MPIIHQHSKWIVISMLLNVTDQHTSKTLLINSSCRVNIVVCLCNHCCHVHTTHTCCLLCNHCCHVHTCCLLCNHCCNVHNNTYLLFAVDLHVIVQCCHGNITMGSLHAAVEIQNILYYCKQYKHTSQYKVFH